MNKQKAMSEASPGVPAEVLGDICLGERICPNHCFGGTQVQNSSWVETCCGTMLSCTPPFLTTGLARCTASVVLDVTSWFRWSPQARQFRDTMLSGQRPAAVPHRLAAACLAARAWLCMRYPLASSKNHVAACLRRTGQLARHHWLTHRTATVNMRPRAAT